MVKTWIASRLKLPRSEVGGVAWRPTNWAMELTSGPFFQMMKYLTPSPVACPCHYRVTCILTDLEVVSMSTSCVFLLAGLAVWILATAWFGTNLGHLAWHVEGALAIWQTGTCWWSPWASVVCCWRLQIHVLSSDICLHWPVGCVLWWRWRDADPRMSNRSRRRLAPAHWTFLRWFLGWSHASRFLPGLEFPIFTCLALDVDHERVLAFHMTFGGTLMAPGSYRTKKIRQRRARVKTVEKRWTHDR